MIMICSRSSQIRFSSVRAQPEAAISQKQPENFVVDPEIQSSQPRNTHQELAGAAIVEIAKAPVEMDGGSISASVEQQVMDMHKQVQLKNEVDEPEDEDAFPADQMLGQAAKTSFQAHAR